MIALRCATGVALAAVYPPAMKMAASWFRAERGLALGLLIGALTLGKAVPHLLTTLFGDAWRLPMVAGVGAGGAGRRARARRSRRTAPTWRRPRASIPHAIRRILSIRGARLATLGYLGHMWELYAMWTWIAVFATASFTAAGLAPASSKPQVRWRPSSPLAAARRAAALAGYSGRSTGQGARRWLGLVDSAAVRGAHHRRFRRTAPFWTFALVMVWGFSVVADSAQFSALVSEYAPADHVGTALTLQTCSASC